MQYYVTMFLEVPDSHAGNEEEATEAIEHCLEEGATNNGWQLVTVTVAPSST